MKNRVELKKTMIYILLSIVLAIIVFSGIYHYQYRYYTNNFNSKISTIVTKLIEEYPELSKNEIIELINSEENNNQELFNTYGIDLNNDSVIMENDKKFAYFSIINILLMIIQKMSYQFCKMKYTKQQ